MGSHSLKIHILIAIALCYRKQKTNYAQIKIQKEIQIKMEIENINPNVYKKCDERKRIAADLDDNVYDPFDEREVFGRSRYSILQ